MVVEKFVSDRMDGSAVSLDVGTTVQVVANKGNWTTVRTPAGVSGDVPSICLQVQDLGPPPTVYSPVYSMVKPTPRTAGFAPPETLAPYVCEFLGTFILVFVVGCCNATGTPDWNATCIGFTLMVLIYAVANISGGNLNPAVSVMLVLTRKLGVITAFLYMILQMLGGILAGMAVSALFDTNMPVGPASPFSLMSALVVEGIYTGMLCFVVGNVAASKRNNPKEDQNQFYALAIGFVIIAGGYAAGDISGACFNPAVAVGLDVAAFLRGATIGVSWMYALIELLGALVAAILYLFIRREDYMAVDNLGAFVPPIQTRMTAEFIGTFILVFTVGLNVVLEHTMTAWSAAAALICMIYALGNVSGGHFNPAVTLGVTFSGRSKCTGQSCIAYMLVQLCAGGVCAFLIYFIHSVGPTSKKVYGLAPQGDYNWCQAFAAEFIYTFLIVYVVLAVATVDPPQTSSTMQNFYFALAIGCCVAIGGFAMGAVSGGSINPAVSLGLAIEASIGHSANSTEVKNPDTTTAPPIDWKEPRVINFIFYSVFELAGATLAAIMFHLTHATEYRKYKQGMLKY